MLRVGDVSSVNYENGTVRVAFFDMNNIVSSEIPMLSNEYNIPDVGDTVACIMYNHGNSKGICLGSFYNSSNKDPDGAEELYIKRFLSEGYIKYSKASKTLTIASDAVAIIGNVTITGNLDVSGDISATGDISAVGTVSGSNIP